ncbi:MAG: OmpA family protein [Deltaproteobacteria bacterium]|nr:OmpA family protein [Deltaproteobacteria bacterium]
MVKGSAKVVLFVVIAAMLLGCAAHQPKAFKPINLASKVKAGFLTQKVDTFLVILDASASMAHRSQGICKLTSAKDIVSRMNQTIPDLKLLAGLRTFGESAFSYPEKTRLIYGMKDYAKAEFEEALKPVTWAGLSPLSAAIDAASDDLKGAGGNIAVIIVSDGVEIDQSAVGAAERMKKAYGDRLCIYTVLVGDDAGGRSLLRRVAAAGQCGFARVAKEIESPLDMAWFVQEVFLMEAEAAAPAPVKPGDSDGDGVVDTKDKCPGTPAGVQVGANGCPFDTDMDGVPDYMDRCPKTPVDAPVNAQGCWVIGPVEFDTAKWNIQPRYMPTLYEIVSVLKKNPWLDVIVEGHTDNRGGEAYNMALSKKRAKAVIQYLVKNGINPDKLTPVGYAFLKPVASNDTPEGRAQNRRAQVRFVR